MKPYWPVRSVLLLDNKGVNHDQREGPAEVKGN